MTAAPACPEAGRDRRRDGRTGTLLAGVALSLVGIVIFMALGIWQIERRAWKLDLIRRVEQRIHAPAVAIPGPEAWAGINARDDAYRHVRLHGRFMNNRETLVQAVTDLGRGFWVLTPLRTDHDLTVLVNRGFVPSERRDPASRKAGNPAGAVEVTGLLRVTEPGGAFLRSNDPAANRWYSRDVDAIAAARGLGKTAPFFIDADRDAGANGGPIGGLTVVSFPNNHLVYALTWFTLAAMLAGWTCYLVRGEWRSRKMSLHSV